MNEESVGSKNTHYGKNVTLTMENIQLITNHMRRTRRNFSQTLNIMLQEWDGVTLQIMKMKREQETKRDLNYLEAVSKAKVIK